MPNAEHRVNISNVQTIKIGQYNYSKNNIDTENALKIITQLNMKRIAESKNDFNE